MAEALRPGFPYRVVGMIHLANDLRLVEPIARDAAFELEVSLVPVAWPDARRSSGRRH